MIHQALKLMAWNATQAILDGRPAMFGLCLERGAGHTRTALDLVRIHWEQEPILLVPNHKEALLVTKELRELRAKRYRVVTPGSYFPGLRTNLLIVDGYSRLRAAQEMNSYYQAALTLRPHGVRILLQ